jgi:hypothetical protein
VFSHPRDRDVGCAWVAAGCVSSNKSTARVPDASGIQCAYTRSVIEESLCPIWWLTYVMGAPFCSIKLAKVWRI